MASSQDEQISHVASITGVSPAAARQILESTNWNTEEAIQLFYESQETEDRDEDNEDDMDDDHNETRPAGSVGAPSSSKPSRQPPQQSRMRTLKDLQGDSHGDESDDEDEKQDFFAGGEKSALAVQNPNNNNNNSQDHFNSIMSQARQNRARPGGDEEPPARQSNFEGRAQTLGGEDAPSRVVGGPSDAPRGQPLPRLTRTLHLWQDGFSVDDGPLFRFDDPQNAPTLALINQGRAPLALLGVEPGQEVDLQLNPHKDEKYVQPKRQYKVFEGSGHRLGSPTPGVAATGSAPASNPAVTTGSTLAAPAAPTMAVDESQPTITLQIRLGDGTRLQSRFNTTHTMGDVYEFVTASSSESRTRSWVLMTTFPSMELSDKGVKLGNLPEFKRGGALVQKWT